MRFLMALPFLVLLGVTASHAEPVPNRSVILDRHIALEFEPQAAFFVVVFDSGAAVRIPALVVPPFKNDSTQGNAAAWLFGARTELPQGTKVVTSFGVVQGPDRKFASLPLEILPIEKIRFGGDSVDALRTYLLEQKGVYSSYKLQLAEIDADLRRLRRDAEVIGNFSRVLEARDEVVKTTNAIQSVDRDIANLERFLRLASSYPVPKNYSTREQQLALQISELGEAAKKAEQGEFARRQSSDGQMQWRLRALEAARGADIPALEEELSKLRAERQRLEKDGATSGHSEAPPATADEL